MSAATRSKYRAVPTVVDNIRFASKAEARRYGELKLLERAGKICDLALQPRFELCVSDPEGEEIKIGTYIADFYYLTLDKYGDNFSIEVVEDVKGFRTDLYKWKKKHFEVQYGIKITEVK